MKYKILIVDDEIIERNGIEFLIMQKRYPFNCYKAKNGVEALEILAAEKIDVVITDIKMPFMDGLELCEKIYENYKNIILVILSGYADFKYAQRAIQHGVVDYILKPVVMDIFYECIDKVVVKLEEGTSVKQGKNVSEEQHYLENDKKVISNIIRLIEENYSNDISLEYVAEKMYLSPGYLSTLFKKNTGKSIVQYITLCRMNKAKQLLTETNMKINDICQKVGYNNTSYFCLIFKKYFGVTANSMRENDDGGKLLNENN